MPISTTNFVGREKELEEIHAKLQTGSVCAVDGMGGLGKSELALQYAWRYRQEYAARYWLPLRGVGLAQAVVTLASRTLPLPEVMQSATLEKQAAWYWQNWLPQKGKVLVIFDDVNDLQSIPKQARPLTDRFQILVTTRKRKLSSQFTEIPLGVISEDEALDLLRKLLGKSRVDRELTAAKAICEYLGYLPLAVELAGRYLQLDEDLRLSDYQQRLTIADESLDLQETEEINAARGVIAAFELSWKELTPLAVRLAFCFSLFALAPIPWDLVQGVILNEKKPKQFSWKSWRNRKTDSVITKQELHKAKVDLLNRHLLENVHKGEEFYQLHHLLREYFKFKMNRSPLLPSMKQSVLHVLIQNAQRMIEDNVLRQEYIVHLEIIKDDFKEIKEVDDIVFKRDKHLLFFKLATFFYKNLLLDESISWCKLSIKFTRKYFGEKDVIYARSLNLLAKLYVSKNIHRDSIKPLFLSALNIYKETRSDKDIVNILEELVTLCHNENMLSDAYNYLNELHVIYARQSPNLNSLQEKHKDLLEKQEYKAMEKITIAVAGQSNTGKTTLVRTLTRNGEFGVVGDTCNTTPLAENCQCSSIQAVFYDCPGFTNIAAFKAYLRNKEKYPHLEEEEVRQMSGVEEKVISLNQHALNAIEKSDVVLYVTHLQEIPKPEEHKLEIELVKSKKTRVIGIINRSTNNPDRVNSDGRKKQWKDFFTGVKIDSFELDAFWDSPSKTDKLYETISNLLQDTPEKQALFSKGLQYFKEKQKSNFQLSSEALAECITKCREIKKSIEDTSNEAQIKLKNELEEEVMQYFRDYMIKVENIYRISASEPTVVIEEQDLRINFVSDNLIGTSGKTSLGAGVGAVAGSLILPAIGTTIGAIIGAAIGYANSRNTGFEINLDVLQNLSSICVAYLWAYTHSGCGGNSKDDGRPQVDMELIDRLRKEKTDKYCSDLDLRMSSKEEISKSCAKFFDILASD